jgi:cytochrome o ubiquinol oxidase subunit 3
MTAETAVSPHHPLTDKVHFGFWLYLMTDLLVFSVLFASFMVLRDATHGGPSGAELFDLNFVLVETMVLLVSSFTCGLGMLAARRQRTAQTFLWFGLTFILGLTFLGMELYEFGHLLAEGHSWQSSAFLSAFFTLVGTHGIHIFAGLLWFAILFVYVAKRGLTESAIRKFIWLSIFWHFLDIVWIFLFTIVYLMGVS